MALFPDNPWASQFTKVATSWTDASDALMRRNPFDRSTWTDALSGNPFASNYSATSTLSPVEKARSFLDQTWNGKSTIYGSDEAGVFGKDAYGSYAGWTDRLSDWNPWRPADTSGKSSVDIASNLDTYRRKMFPWLFDETTPTAGGSSGTVASIGVQTSDALNPYITQAVQQINQEMGIALPANLVKAMLWQEGGAQGNSATVPLRGEMIYGFNGIFQSTAAAHGINWQQMIGNPQYAVYAMAKVLADIAKDDAGKWGGTSGQTVAQGYGWQGVASVFFSGKVGGGFTDENGMSTDQYTNSVMTLMQQYDQKSGGITSGIAGGAGAGGLPTSIWGNAPGVTETQGFGQTSFSESSQGQGMYGSFDPTTAQQNWGFQGGHSGRDYSVAYGTSLYTPVDGTVSIAGGEDYYYNTGPGGGAGVPGQGELMLKLDNGDELILGHMSAINVQVGQRVNAGSFVGLSGTDNGDHVHVEYRLYDPTWQGIDGHMRIVDPTLALAGGTSGGGVTTQDGQVTDFHSLMMLAQQGQLQGHGAAIPYAGSIAHPGWSNALHSTLLGTYGQAPTTGISGPSGLPTAARSGKGADLVSLAQSYLGTRYVYGGQDPKTGWDCSGFAQWLYAREGKTIPRTSEEQFAGGTPVSRDQLQPGDLVFFSTDGPGASHVAIYIGNGQIIHAANPDIGTVLSSMDDRYYTDSYVGARRY